MLAKKSVTVAKKGRKVIDLSNKPVLGISKAACSDSKSIKHRADSALSWRFLRKSCRKIAKKIGSRSDSRRLSFSFPLYFGWEAEFILRRVKNWRSRLLVPFDRHWQYLTVVFLLIALVSSVLLIRSNNPTSAATYDWFQTAWNAATANDATHPGGQADWDEYRSKDANLLAGNSLELTASATSSVQTTDTDFNSGSSTFTRVVGEGQDANITLSAASLIAPPRLVGSIHINWSAKNVVTMGDYAYVSYYYGGLRVFDVSDKENPAWIIDYNPTPAGPVNSAYIVGSLAYLACGNAGMFIVDISNPASPQQLSYATTTDAQGVYVSGIYAYVADAGTGMQIIDISSSTNPVKIKIQDTPGSANNVFVSGSYAYVADNASGLQIVDVTDVFNPSIAYSTSTGDKAYDVFYDNNKLYLADGTAGLRIYNVSNPMAPVYMGSYDTDQVALKIYLDGTHAYVADNADGVRIIDVTNPASPILSSYYDTVGNAYGVYVLSGYCYVADYNSGLQIIDVTGLTNLRLIDSYDTAGESQKSFISGHYAYVADGTSGLLIIDVINPATTTYVGGYDTSSSTGVYVSGNYAYLSDNTDGLVIVNVSDPANPALAGSYATGTALGIAVSGNYAYLADGANGLVVFDVSDPANPAPIGFYDTAGTAYGVTVSGNYAYLADGSAGLIILDISDPANPALAGSHDTSGTAFRVAVSGHYAYLADGASGLQVIDIATATAPSPVSTFDTSGNTKDVFIQGSNAYIADSDSGLQVIDISDPAVPVVGGIYDSPGSGNGVFVINNYACFADGESGLQFVLTEEYDTSGVYTSAALDLVNTEFGTVSWNVNTPSSTAYAIKARTSDSSDMSDASDWSLCDTLASGQDLSTSNCVDDVDRYFQYQISFSTSDEIFTPTLFDLTINYTRYPMTQSLLSSYYDSGNVQNMIGRIIWNENSSLPSGTGVNIYLRASSSLVDLANENWTQVASSQNSFLTPGCAKSDTAVTCGNSIIPSGMIDQSGDRYFQYRVDLTSLGSTTPAFSDIALRYVVNEHPEFNPDYPVAAAGGATANQASDGLVNISYSVRDPDSTSGTLNPGYITPSFEYSLDGGASWTSIVSDLSANATSSKAVDEASYIDYSLTWNPKAAINNQYSTTTKIRVTVDDSEGANNTFKASTANFIVDTKDPVINITPKVIATTTPATLIFSMNDDSALEMMTSLNSDYVGASWAAYNSTTSIALATDPDTVYARFRDAYNNITSSSVATPQTPTKVIIRDVSNSSAGDYRLFLAWQTTSIPPPDFYAYHIWRSLDGISYVFEDTIYDRLTNYYLTINLTAATAYYYKVAAEDVNGNVSYFSSVLTDVPDDMGGSDIIAPAISNVEVAATSTQTARIEWDTDELATSSVAYGTSPGAYTGTTTANTLQDYDGNYGKHVINLTGLSASTTYYFKVLSTDASGNTAIADNGGVGYTFDTKSGAIISNVSTLNVGNVGATITWDTDINSDSYVYYSVNSDLTNSLAAGQADSVMSHSVSLTGLSMGTRYYYYAASGLATDDNSGAYYTFMTSSDSAAPVISSVAANLITDTAASISWTTDENADSKLYYGTASGNYTASSSVSGLSTGHTINLSSLSYSTAYYYIVVSADAGGNTATSSEYSFTTLAQMSTQEEVDDLVEAARTESRTASGGGGILITEKIVERIIDLTDRIPPKITNVEQFNISSTSITIRWETDEKSDSFVEFGMKTGNEFTLGQRDLGNVHVVNLNSLLPLTTYKFQVTSADIVGNLSKSEQMTFKTLSENAKVAQKSREDLLSNRIRELEQRVQLLLPRQQPVLTTEQALRNALDALRRNAGTMGLNNLTDTLLTSYNTIEDIAKIIPSPKFGGEPQVEFTSNTATFTWRTDKDSDSFIAIAPEDNYARNRKEPYMQLVGNPTDKTRNHTVVVYNLKADTVYHYQARSKAVLGQMTSSKDYTFRTLKERLEITNLTVQNISSQEAVFKWVTTQETNSQLKYIPYHGTALAVDEAKIKSDKAMTTIHEINVSDFEGGITYQIEVSGKDTAGFSVAKTMDSFSTSEDNYPPVVSAVQTEAALSPGKELKVQAIITWMTNEPSTSRVFYEKGLSQTDKLQNQTKLDTNYTKKHVVVITSFDPGTVYRFKVESMDSGGNTTLSKTYTILTPRQKESVFQMILKNFEDMFGWMSKMR